jgi:putative phage-type endonuclease
MLTQAALDRRTKYLTASDVPAIMGIKAFNTPLAIWAQKTGQAKPEEGQGEDKATTFGDDFEDALIYRAARVANLTETRRNQWRVHGGGILAATLDALAKPVHQPVQDVGIEAKTSGIVTFNADLSGWGPDGSAEIPDRVNVQVQTQMLCGGHQKTYVSALLGGGLGYRLYPILRDDEVCGLIEETCTAWWKRHVINGEPPKDIFPEDVEVVRCLRRHEGKTTVVEDALVTLWQDRKATLKAAQESADQAQANLIMALGDCTIGRTQALGYVKYKEEGAGSRLDAQGLKADHPDIFEKFSVASTRRVLRVSKNP